MASNVPQAAVTMLQPIINGLVIPRLNALLKERQINKKVTDFRISEDLERYLASMYEACSFVQTIVFQNTKKKLEELYVPLTLHSQSEDFVAHDYDAQFVARNPRILIADGAGMGKSTVLKWLFLRALVNPTHIPIFIALRRIDSKRSILDQIGSILSPLSAPMEHELLAKLLEAGGFVFFLDGFDEIPVEEQEGALNLLTDFFAKANRNFSFLTSRKDGRLASLADFKGFDVKQLSKSEAESLLKKYGENGEAAEKLIEDLQQPRNKIIHSFLGNPLLVSMLYCAYEYNRQIPLSRVEFFEQVFNALFERHDFMKPFSRQKLCGLDRLQFAEIVRNFAIRSAVKLGKIEYSMEEAAAQVESAKVQAGLNFSTMNFLVRSKNERTAHG